MGKIHINLNGEPRACKVTVGSCPYGEHFDSMDEYNSSMVKEHGLLASHSRYSIVGATDTNERAVIVGASNLSLHRGEMLSGVASFDSLVKHGILSADSKLDNFLTGGAREKARRTMWVQIDELRRIESGIEAQRSILSEGMSVDEETAQRYASMSPRGRRDLRLAIHNAISSPSKNHLNGQKDIGDILRQVEEANGERISSTPMGRWMTSATYADMKDACSDMLAKGSITPDELSTLSGEKLTERLEQHMSGVPSVVESQPMKRNIPPVANPETYTAEELVDALESEREKPKVHTEQRRASGIAGALGVLKAVRIEEPNEREIALSEYRRTLSPTQQDLINTMMEAKSIGASQGVIDQINNAYKHEKAMGYNRAWDEALQEQRDRDALIMNNLNSMGLSGQASSTQQGTVESRHPRQSPPTPTMVSPREQEWRNAMAGKGEKETVEVPDRRSGSKPRDVRQYLDGQR